MIDKPSPDPDTYLDINRHSWNNRVASHLASTFYDVDGFLKGESSLNEIELKLLGDLKGKSVLHLQCHFGQDTISLARMGAIATGVDFSDQAILAAAELSIKAGVATKFICCNVYDLPLQLDETFDVVFTSYGTISWLPDLDRWASVISDFLKPGGKFIIAEFHPVVWMFDDDFKTVKYHYHNVEPVSETENGTYADRNAAITLKSITWNHGISEVMNNLLKHGIEINSFNEMDYSPYNCFRHMVETEPGKFRIKHLANKIPMVYSIEATKKIQ